MNDQPVTPTAKPKRTHKPAAPVIPRTRKPMDHRKAALRDEYLKKVAEIGREDASARIKRVIIDKRLPKMTKADRLEIYDHLGGEFTPKLPFPESPAGPPHGSPAPDPIVG